MPKRLKDDLELKWWKQADLVAQQSKMLLYLEAFGLSTNPVTPDVLEIGTGPLLGLLPYFQAPIRVGVDPMIDRYREAGLLRTDVDCKLVNCQFERWGTSQRFSTIVSADALDHGEMGFHLIPKIAELLKPGGCFYLHVHLRPKDYINLIHDHQLTQLQLDDALAHTNLQEQRRVLYPKDIDGQFCEALVGVWRKPLQGN